MSLSSKSFRTLDTDDIGNLTPFKTRKLMKTVVEKLDEYEPRERHELHKGSTPEEVRWYLSQYLGRLKSYEQVEEDINLRIVKESDLVELFCEMLYSRGIEYETEVPVSSYSPINEYINPRVDIVLKSSNIAIECKRDNSTSKIQKAIGQCAFYRHAGYSPCILVPKREGEVYDHEDIIENCGIVYCEMVDFLEMKVICGEGISRLYLENI